MKPLQIKIRFVSSVGKSELIELYKDAGWWREEYGADTSFLDGIASGSFCFAGAFLDGRLIGMGRALSDGCSDAYIQDVAVLKKYRGMGIGRKIVSAIVERLEDNGIDWIGLVAEPGTGKFYGKLDFKTVRGFKLMLLEK